MSEAVFSAPDLTPSLSEYILDGPEGKHAVSVKRLQLGEKTILTNGNDCAAYATVDHILDKTRMRLSIDEYIPVIAQTPSFIVIQALPKSDRAEEAIDLAVQAGADRVIPWSASRCVSQWSTPQKAQKGVTKWRNAALAAAKQSRRLVAADVEDLQSTDQIIERFGHPQQDMRVLVLHEQATCAVSSVDLNAETIVVIIGPEGGISDEELEAFRGAGFIPVLLGAEVLRSAHAGGIAVGALSAVTGRWDRAAKAKNHYDETKKTI